MEHIDESILTNCCKCKREVWCSITNSHHKPICLLCGYEEAQKHDTDMGATEETLIEAAKNIIDKKKSSNKINPSKPPS